jgi:hypothetical protein
MTPPPKKLADQILNTEEKSPEQMYRWVEMQPEFDELQRIVTSDGKLKLPKPTFWQQPLKFVKSMLWMDESTLYGRAWVDPNLVSAAKTTATTLSVANLINTLSTIPYLLYAFADLGGIGTVLSATVGLLLNQMGNTLGEAACLHQNRKEARTGLVGFLLLNLVLTLASGPGIELLLDPSGLAERRSREIVREKVLDNSIGERNLAERQEKVREAQEKCDTVVGEIKAAAADNPNRDFFYNQAYGLWSERNRNWGQVPLTDLPLCRKAERLEEETQIYAERIRSELEAHHEEIHRYGSDLLYLQAVRPDIYRMNFHENGVLRSGLVASRLSIQGFAEKLGSGDLSDLGFPLFFFAISLVTSGIAVAKVAFYAQREDVERSWDSELYQVREELFDRILKGLDSIEEPQSQELPASLNGSVKKQ